MICLLTVDFLISNLWNEHVLFLFRVLIGRKNEHSVILVEKQLQRMVMSRIFRMNPNGDYRTTLPLLGWFIDRPVEQAVVAAAGYFLEEPVDKKNENTEELLHIYNKQLTRNYKL